MAQAEMFLNPGVQRRRVRSSCRRPFNQGVRFVIPPPHKIDMIRLLLLPLITVLLLSCASPLIEPDDLINQTGMVSCKYTSKTAGQPITRHKDLRYGDGTVQSRSSAYNGLDDCYEKVGGGLDPPSG
jgi:hypothetical protein